MGKPFFEVFPSLTLEKRIHDYLEQTSVEKISATRSRDFLRIHLFSTKLITKDIVKTVEKQIKTQLFSDVKMTVKIYERFELSKQYTPQKLLDVYYDSILQELLDYSHVEYNTFRTAKIDFPEENRMILTVDDNVLVRGREQELVRILEKILVERCGFPIAIQMAYQETEKKREDDDFVVVSPDVGSVARARNFAQKVHMGLAIVDKRRQRANECEVMNVIGDVAGKTCILYDDMVDTAGSLCNAAKALVEVGGAKEVYACATHGVLSGPAYDRIENSVIKEMLFLNTIPQVGNTPSKKIKFLDVAPIFARAIEHIHGGTSIADLF